MQGTDIERFLTQQWEHNREKCFRTHSIYLVSVLTLLHLSLRLVYQGCRIDMPTLPLCLSIINVTASFLAQIISEHVVHLRYVLNFIKFLDITVECFEGPA